MTCWDFPACCRQYIQGNWGPLSRVMVRHVLTVIFPHHKEVWNTHRLACDCHENSRQVSLKTPRKYVSICFYLNLNLPSYPWAGGRCPAIHECQPALPWYPSRLFLTLSIYSTLFHSVTACAVTDAQQNPVIVNQLAASREPNWHISAVFGSANTAEIRCCPPGGSLTNLPIKRNTGLCLDDIH